MAPDGGNAGGPGVSALRGFSLWRLCRLGSTDRHTHDIREKRRSLSIFAVRVGFRYAYRERSSPSACACDGL
jgi:hypothetical protein